MKAINGKKLKEKSYIVIEGVNHEYDNIINYSYSFKFSFKEKIKILLRGVFSVKAHIYLKGAKPDFVAVTTVGIIEPKAKEIIKKDENIQE